MGKKSAGILVYKKDQNTYAFLLVHPGGPFYKNKDEGCWSIPKGEFEGEEVLIAAKREFKEELGFDIDGDFITLNPVKQKSGKTVYAFAVEAEIDISNFKSNFFTIEWPPKSQKFIDFPEVDKVSWFNFQEAKIKCIPSQVSFFDQLKEKIGIIENITDNKNSVFNKNNQLDLFD